MKLSARLLPALVLGSVLFPPLSGGQLDLRHRLEIGDPRYQGQTVDVAPGQIISRETGKPISFEEMIREMKSVPFVHIGESHGFLPSHELQARIIRALFEQDPRLAVGLEMVPAARQEILDQWSLGLLSDEEFLRKDKWYSTWGFHFGYYRPTMAFAKDNRIPLHAIDSPRDVVGRFQMKDGEVMAAGAKPASTRTDPADEEGRLLIRKNLESSDLPDEIKKAMIDSMLEELYQASVSRDRDIAAHAVRVQKREGRKVVVLIGAGHLFYGHGLIRTMRELGDFPSKSAVPVIIPRDRAALTVSRGLADYIVGFAAEEDPALPSAGLTFKTTPDDPRLIIAARPVSGSARGSGFEAGDIILSVDGREFSETEDLLIYLAGIPWGGKARFRISRMGEARTVTLNIKKTP